MSEPAYLLDTGSQWPMLVHRDSLVELLSAQDIKEGRIAWRNSRLPVVQAHELDPESDQTDIKYRFVAVVRAAHDQHTAIALSVAPLASDVSNSSACSAPDFGERWHAIVLACVQLKDAIALIPDLSRINLAVPKGNAN